MRTPAATASRTQSLTWPDVQQRVRLPVVGAERDPLGPVAQHRRDQRGEVREAEPCLTKIHMPLRRFSSASSRAVHSWSDSTPAAR